MEKIHLVFVTGIRTHYIKLYALQQELRTLNSGLLSNFSFTFIDAKQHYDSALHDDFINELNLEIDYTLEHERTDGEYLWGSMLQKLCSLYDQINDSCPIDYVVVFGDVITTVIASVAAMLKKYKLIHIEAGTRVKFGNSVEESCRKTVDHLSTMRFVSNYNDLSSLKSEGLSGKSFFQVI